MNSSLKSFFKQILASFNTCTTDSTDPALVKKLIQKLHPIKCKKELIRMGPNGDGGYLLPDDLLGINTCFSPGVSDVSGFEKDCADLGMEVYLADKSVDKPEFNHDKFHFTKKFIGATNDDTFMTLDNWVINSGKDNGEDLLLQIDIEGYEYEVFLATSDKLMKRFRVIVAEFHQLDKFWSEPYFNLTSRAIEKILETHSCVHLHPNNCKETLNINGLNIPKVMELTFVRNDRVEKESFQTSFPHSLDFDCTDNKSTTLSKCWYRQITD
ncbi:MAG: FkbM family methyltransferase [Desulfotalea sp.]